MDRCRTLLNPTAKTSILNFTAVHHRACPRNYLTISFKSFKDTHATDYDVIKLQAINIMMQHSILIQPQGFHPGRLDQPDRTPRNPKDDTPLRRRCREDVFPRCDVEDRRRETWFSTAVSRSSQPKKKLSNRVILGT
jgi:hypothetical protein